MDMQDLIIEARDASLTRLGAIVNPRIEITEVLNGIGMWSLTLDRDDPMHNVMLSPGAGIVAWAYGDVVFSGFVSTTETVSNAESPAGSTVFSGVSDSATLWDRLAYPYPETADTTQQARDFDAKTLPAESLAHYYVSRNIGSLAAASRRITTLTQSADLARGRAVTKSARFDNLGDLVSDICKGSELGFSITHRGNGLVFDVTEHRDFSATVRLDMENRTLSSQRLAVTAPQATHVIVGQAEVNFDRLFNTVSTPESEVSAKLWSRRVEKFLDQRQTPDVEESTQGARELLAQDALSQVIAQTIPAETANMGFLKDFRLGDRVGVTLEGQQAVARVTGFVLKVTSDGPALGMILGDAEGFDLTARLAGKVQRIESALSRLERNPATNIGPGGIDNVLLDPVLIETVSDTKDAVVIINDITIPEIRDTVGQAELRIDDMVSDIVAAEAAALAAKERADVAIESADGKNTITHSLNPPGTAPNVAGDVWFQKDAGNVVIGQWEGQGEAAWVEQTVGSEVIANLDVAKLSGGFIDAARIETRSLLVGGTTLGVTLDGKETPSGAQGKADAAKTAAVNELKTVWGHPSNRTLIDGAAIYTNTIRAQHLALSDFSNYLPPINEWPTNSILSVGAKEGGELVIVGVGNGSSNTHFSVGGRIPVVAGDQFRFEWDVYSSFSGYSGQSGLYVQFFKADGEYVSATGGAHANQNTGGLYNRLAADFTIPPTVTEMQVVPFVGATHKIAMHNVRLRRKNGGNLIVDGAIDGKTITGATIIGAEIKTAATGQRVEIGTDGYESVDFHSGNSGEAQPASISNMWLGSQGSHMIIKGATKSGETKYAEMTVGAVGTGTDGKSITGVKTYSDNFEAQAKVGATMMVTGGASVTVNAQDVNTTGANLNHNGGSVTWVGEIRMHYGNNIPSGWLVCNGSAFSGATYPKLQAQIGGTTLPDFRGRTPVGVGTGDAGYATAHSIGQKKGAEKHALTAAQNGPHQHTVGQDQGYTDLFGTDNGARWPFPMNKYYVGYGPMGTSWSGSGEAHNIMQPSLVVNFIIRAV